MMLPSAVAQAICRIRFPPEGDITTQAQHATLLLMAKDRLHALAAPARGLTIAYTAMFAGVALPVLPGEESCLTRLLRKFGCAVPNDVAVPSGADTDSREKFHGLAVEAYPHLVRRAQRFRQWFRTLPWFAFVWAVITAMVYWNVALTNDVLKRITTLQEQQTHLVTTGQTFIANEERCRPPIQGSSDAETAARGAICDQFRALQNQLTGARLDLVAITERHLWSHPVGWVVGMFNPRTRLYMTPDQQTTAPDLAREQLAGVVVGVFTNYVIPMMFGLLGTLAGVVRTIWAKARDSLLSPRDERLAIASVPLGLVAGLAVGLIVTPSGTAVQGVSNVAGSITLSATALAFLAGYGAESFFTMIDELLKRVFALGNQPSAR